MSALVHGVVAGPTLKKLTPASTTPCSASVPGGRREVRRVDLHQLLDPELVDRIGSEAERLRVQRLLEERPGEARIAEAFAASHAVEDSAQLRLRVRRERVAAS